MPSVTSTKQACDHCHTRKLKCSGTAPCVRCSSIGSECTFLKPRRNRGPLPRYVYAFVQQNHVTRLIIVRKRFQRRPRASEEADLAPAVDTASIWNVLADVVWRADASQSPIWAPTSTDAASVPPTLSANNWCGSGLEQPSNPASSHDDMQRFLGLISSTPVPQRIPTPFTARSPSTVSTGVDLAALLGYVPTAANSNVVSPGIRLTAEPSMTSNSFPAPLGFLYDGQQRDDGCTYRWDGSNDILQGVLPGSSSGSRLQPPTPGPNDNIPISYPDVDACSYDFLFPPMDSAIQQISSPTPTHALASTVNAPGNAVAPTTTTMRGPYGPILPPPPEIVSLLTAGPSNSPFWHTPAAVPLPIGTDFLSLVFIESFIRPQVEVYFDRINPMMPVIAREEIMGHLDESAWLANRDNLALVLAAAGIALVHPWTAEEKAQRRSRERQAIILLDQACRLVAAWDYGCKGTVEKTLTSFIMFGILHELGHVWGARMRLRDAITMGDSMQLGNRLAYGGLDPWEARRRLRLFYILAVTER